MNKQKILFLIHHIECELPALIEEVLNDSQEDPHYSAVYVSNLIKTCAELSKDINIDPQYSTVEEYFLLENMNEEYLVFMEKFNKEAEYYIGKIY